MKARVWLRSLAVLLALFALGHTLGTAAPKVVHGPGEASVFEAMQNFRFPIMGFNRTHWELYRGFALIISLQLLVMMAVAWQLSVIGESNARLALPMAVTLQIGCIGLLILSWRFFFTAPIIMSFIAVLFATVAVIQLYTTVRRSPQGLRHDTKT